MSRVCCVEECTSKYNHETNDTIFSFPKNLEEKNAWLRAIPGKLKNCSFICINHFDENYIKRIDNFDGIKQHFERPILKPGALPTIFNCIPNHLKRELPLPNNLETHKPHNNLKSIIDVSDLTIKNEMIVCRACLCDDVNILESFFDKPSILDLYVSCTFLQVEMDDGLPMNLCLSCIKKCLAWISFKKLCEDNESLLRSKLTTNETVFPLIIKPTNNFNEKNEIIMDTMLDPPIPITTNDKMSSEVSKIKNENFFDENNENNENNVKIEFLNIEIITNLNSIPTLLSQPQPDVTVTNKVTSQKPYECDTCYKLFSNSTSLRSHRGSHKKNYFEFETTSAAKIEPYVERPFKCDMCNKDFAQKTCLRSHIYRVHTKQFKCQKCKKKFLTQFRLNDHTCEQPLKCEICNKFFSNSKNLYSHKQIHFDQIKYLCSICGKTFKKCSTYKEHLVRHTGERPFPCPMCNKAFSIKGMLTRHLVLHQTDRPYKCSICNKYYKSKPCLRLHLKIHVADKSKPKTYSNDNKRFKCNVCNQSFLTQKELSLDLKTHDDGSVFRCTYCDKAFKKNCDLTIHLRRHTGERPFSCNLCTETFGSPKMLKIHNHKKHVNKNA